MEPRDVLIELYGRIDGHVSDVLEGLGPDDLVWSPAPGTNPIGWLIWHLSRVMDHHVSELAGSDQTWTTGVWAKGFGIEAYPTDTGYAHGADQVRAIRPSSVAAVGAYFTRVAEHTRDFLESIDASDLERIVDTRWDPPVTMQVRLISVADDAIQHAGAASYLKGLLPR